jgi:CDP-diacylglycerol--glycerol-3-phosphate 3-phosphatidyltransferase
MLNFPTILTIIRILLAPVMMVLFYIPSQTAKLVTVIIFILASITDWLDGFIARRWRQTSQVGAFLDPVADKIMVSVALVMIVGDYGYWLFAIPASVIIGREITISALREWMAEIGKRSHVEVSQIGKIKTATQMIAIILLLYKYNIGFFPTEIVGLVLLYVAAILTLWSMALYLKAAWQSLKTPG